MKVTWIKDNLKGVAEEEEKEAGVLIIYQVDCDGNEGWRK